MVARALALVFLLALSSCAPKTTPIVINKFPGASSNVGHTVSKGETLYSIAWGVGLDFHKIAKWNNIAAPYTIYPGQVIRLTAPSGGSGASSSRQTTTATKTTTSTKASSKTTTQKNTNAATTQASKPIPKENIIRRWFWPAKGKVIQNYKPSAGVNGIRIAAKEGSAVNAAAPGEVVYVGEGLRGYGKLVLIKHNTTFLSAYAHNKSISVSEGQKISIGQQIAKMGSSGAAKTMLHFEIRRDGKPIDPLIYLK